MRFTSFSHCAILQTAFLGDVALSLYFAQEIKRVHPNIKITFVTTPQASRLVQMSSDIDSVIVFDKRSAHRGLSGLKTLSTMLKQQSVDVVFGLQRSIRTSLVCALSGAKVRCGFRQATGSYFYTHRVPWLLGFHETERNNSLLSVFEDYQVPLSPRQFEPISYTISQESKDVVHFLLNRTNSDVSLPVSPIVVIAPSSMWETKRWKEESFRQVVCELTNNGMQVIVIGASNDSNLCQRVCENTSALNAAGKLDIPATMYLLSLADCLVANDSAPTHFAQLVGCKTITIFGSTIPEFGFAPRGRNDISIENTDLSCRPCGLHGYRHCPRNTLECMTSITPAMVLRHIFE